MHVVDTGKEKTNTYDYQTRTTILGETLITDASRLQRKGRVGRVAPGWVYYMYPENALVDVKKQYKICNEDINQSIFLSLLRDPDDFPLFVRAIDQIVSGRNIDLGNTNNIVAHTSILTNQYNRMFVRYKLTPQYIKKYVDGIVEIITAQYYTAGTWYGYQGNMAMYDYENNTTPPTIYSSGFDTKQLSDKTGTFYLIHPDELKITRNIRGEVVSADGYQVELVDLVARRVEPVQGLGAHSTGAHGTGAHGTGAHGTRVHGMGAHGLVSNQYVKTMQSNKIIVFWETLLNRGFVGIRGTQFVRSGLGEIAIQCATALSMLNASYTREMLFFGYGLSRDDKEFERILRCVCLLEVLGGDLINLVPMDVVVNQTILTTQSPELNIPKPIDPLELAKIKQAKQRKLAQAYGFDAYESELDVLENIAKQIELIAQGADTNSSNRIETNILNDQKIAEKIAQIEMGTARELAKRDVFFEALLARYENSIRPNLVASGMSIKLITRYFVIRERTRHQWDDLIKGISNRDDLERVDVRRMRAILKNHRSYADSLGIDLLRCVALLASPYTIGSKIHATSSYVSVYNPHPTTVMSLSTTNRWIDPMYCQEYIHYLTANYEKREYGMISRVTEKDMMMLANIYNKQEMDRKFSDNMIGSDKLHMVATVPRHPAKMRKTTEYLDMVYRLSAHIQNSRPLIEYLQSSQILAIYGMMGTGYARYGALLRVIDMIRKN
jgi:hypothetical protein